MNICKHSRRQGTVFIAFGILMALGALQPYEASAQAAPGPTAAPNRYAATIAPLERFEIDGVLVERHGSANGRPLILVPGLASGSWAWQDTIRAFSGSNPVYVLTLPGFDGRPAAPQAGVAAARAALARLIAQRKLAKPVIVGHSLGGTLGVVSIDGLPVMPGTETMAPAQRASLAEGMRSRVAAAPAAFAAQQQTYMRTIGVLDMGKADELAKLSARSDPAAVGRYAADVLSLDLRPGLKDIQAPVLVISPWHDLDAAQQGVTENAKTDYYRSLLEGAPRVEVVSVAPARHFAMLDQPQKVNEAIRAFLSSL